METQCEVGLTKVLTGATTDVEKRKPLRALGSCAALRFASRRLFTL